MQVFVYPAYFMLLSHHNSICPLMLKYYDQKTIMKTVLGFS